MFWYRAVNDKPNNRIYCLVHAEKLSYNVCSKALQNFELITRGCSGIGFVGIIGLHINALICRLQSSCNLC